MKKQHLLLLVLALLLLLGIGVAFVKQRQARLEAERAAEFAARQASVAPAPVTQPSLAPRQKQWQDPEARDALALVGSDSVAEQYWLLAINNSKLPAKERQDLIEDLNEEGFTNAKNPTPEDIKIIEHRIKLIDELAPHAMDNVNADAFREARKDLAQMLKRGPR
jgi:hypothetical protein